MLDRGLVDIGITYSEMDLRVAALAIGRETGERLAHSSDEFSVELLKRAKAVVPYGPSARTAYSIKTRKRAMVRERGRDGLTHPGALQRSGRRRNAIVTPTVTERVLSFDTPYAAYQHGGKSRQSGYSANLQYTKAGRQANYLFDMGHRSEHKSPLDVMIGAGRLLLGWDEAA